MSNEQMPMLSELIREHIAITQDEVPVLIEFMDYAQHMERQLVLGRLDNEMSRSVRTKDAELIQMLVNALANLRDIHEFRVGREPLTGTDELAAAEAAGFKPSEQ